jgi:geranylgeranyl pyrophosphate synthase
MAADAPDKSFALALKARRDAFDAYMAAFVRRRYPLSEPAGQLNEVIAYVLAGRGKRVRPLLAMLAAEACGGQAEQALPAALAVELVHTYSLVHDDLPCMDDDDQRRGVPTAHKAFDEPRALLAGDAMLTDAFAFLSADLVELNPEAGLSAAVRMALVAELARAGGSGGMVLGQALDLYWTGRGGATRLDLDRIHRHKTGDLIGAACAMGAWCAGADAATAARLREFGQLIGLAFQITDDLLDEDATTGKTAGKDREAGKLTYLATMPREDAAAAAAACTRDATALLAALRMERAEPLVAFSRLLLSRHE